MKKNIRNAVIRFLLLGFAGVCSACVFVACDGSGDTGWVDGSPVIPEGETPITLALGSENAGMILGDETELAINYNGEKSALSWSSSDPSVATVENGVVAALSEGETTVTVTDGTRTDTCTVTVGFGNLQPTLVLDYITSDSVKISKNSTLAVEGKVCFNGKSFPCELSVAVEDNEVLSYSEGELKGLEFGTSEVFVSTVWKQFDSALLSASFEVTVIKNIVLTALVEHNGELLAQDEVELNLLKDWQGEHYGENKLTFQFIAYENGVDVSNKVEMSIPQGSAYVAFDKTTGIATPKQEGRAKIRGRFTDEDGITHTKEIYVDVVCPVAAYTEEVVYCTQEAFDVESYFGEGAKITSAYQGGEEIVVSSNVVSLLARGLNTEPVEIRTNKGGLRFEKLNAYTAILNNDNFSECFLADKEVNGYYLLGGNVTVDMSAQSAGSTTNGFAGVFDGKGYTVNATVSTNGIFGQLLNGAEIVDTHFNFTFIAGSDGTACGLASNAANVNTPKVKLNNLYVTSTNYLEHSYSLMLNAVHNLTMKDVYVNISVGEETTGALSQRAALFRFDKRNDEGVAAANEVYKGAVSNVYVVTGAFIAISDGVLGYGVPNRAFVTYAANDMEKIGAVQLWEKGSFQRLKLYDNTDATDNNKYFGMIHFNNVNGYGAVPYQNYDKEIHGALTKQVNSYTYIYNYMYRYDTVAELLASGVTKVGTWEVK